MHEPVQTIKMEFSPFHPIEFRTDFEGDLGYLGGEIFHTISRRKGTVIEDAAEGLKIISTHTEFQSRDVDDLSDDWD